jgi:hypothetical protein
MRDDFTVLLLGSSLFVYTESPDDSPMTACVAAELRRLRPDINWRCEGATLRHSPHMLERCDQILDSIEPDIVVLDPRTFQLVHEAVITRIKNRWPALYPAANTAMAKMKAWCGGGFEGGEAMLERIYTAAHDLALRVIGGDTDVSVEQVIENNTKLMDRMLARESLVVISRAPSFWWHEPSFVRSRAQAKISRVRAALADYCRRRSIASYDFAEELAKRNKRILVAKDNMHYAAETREDEARILAPIILASIA